MSEDHSSIVSALLGFDYAFKQPKLLRAALTHPSITRKGNEDYERLEFLGDRVLGLVMSEYLYETFPRDKEGVLAKKLAALVSKPPLVKVAHAIDLPRYLHMSDGERRTGGLEKESNLADAMEAVIGALYLDGGLEKARTFILMHWSDLMDTVHEYALLDAKSTLQEMAQAKGSLPQYTLLKKEGEDHDPLFTMGVRLTDQDDFTVGRGRSKRLAEKDAAGRLLKILKKESS